MCVGRGLMLDQSGDGLLQKTGRMLMRVIPASHNVMEETVEVVKVVVR